MAKGYKIPQLGIRMVRERTLALPFDRAGSPAEVAEIAFKLIGRLPVERLIAITVDGRGNITAVLTLSQGGMSGTGVRCSDVMRAVLATHAAAFVLAHNHPSGDPTPSEDDQLFTGRVQAAAAIVQCPLLDHVVVTREPGVYRSVAST